MNMNRNLGENTGQDWSQQWAITCWKLWSWRNKDIHEENYIKPHSPSKEVIKFVNEVQEAKESLILIKQERRIEEIQVKWKPPPIDWFKINTDGAVSVRKGWTACGGLIRDHNGRWIAGFTSYLGLCSVLKAEIWGAIIGVRLAKKLGIQRVIIESDSKLLVDGYREEKMLGMDIARPFQILRSLLREFEQSKVEHTWRQGNICADHLASLGLNSETVREFEEPPHSLATFLLADQMGIQFPRLVSM